MIVIKSKGNDLYLIGHSTSQICASVSTITCMLYNLLAEFDEEFEYYDDGVTMHFEINETETTKKISKIALDCLHQLSEQFPNDVTFETK